MSAKSKHLQDAIFLLKSFVQSPQNQNLTKIKSKSLEDFEKICSLDFSILSNGKGLAEIKNTFKVLLNYLKKYYQKEEAEDLLILVERAMNKLDEYHSLTENDIGKVAETREYTHLKSFYFSKVLGSEAVQEDKKTGIYDLEGVVKDRDYELFYIRKEDGSRYFDKELIKKIRLSSDFAHLKMEDTLLDPVLGFQEMLDYDIQSIAKFIFDKNYYKIQGFLQQTIENKNWPLFMAFRKALMALMLATLEKNALINAPKKTCTVYFKDFQTYLRSVIQSPNFLDMLHQQNKKTQEQELLVECVLGICVTLYTADLPDHSKFTLTKELIKRGGMRQASSKDKKLQLFEQVRKNADEFSKELEHYVHGPVIKVWDFLQDPEHKFVFDTLMQNNLPYNLFDLEMDAFSTSCLRLPSPTRQEYIHKIDILEEFKDFLRGMHLQDKSFKHLMFNLQDRTCAKEYPRCLALEAFQRQAEFVHLLYVVTLPKNTDFYMQRGVYQEIEKASDFLYAFQTQIEAGPSCGFFFPETLSPSFSAQFIERMLKTVHKCFFQGKKQLSEEDKKAFIELVYLCIQIKALEEVCPKTFSFTCKDAIDTGGVSNALFYCFVVGLKQNEPDQDFLNRIIFEVPMMLRERAMIDEDLKRFELSLKAMGQSIKSSIKELNTLFNTDLSKWRLF